MNTNMFVAARQGLILAERQEEGWRAVSRNLDGQPITSVAVSGEVILAGARQGIYRSGDAGETWDCGRIDRRVPRKSRAVKT